MTAAEVAIGEVFFIAEAGRRRESALKVRGGCICIEAGARLHAHACRTLHVFA
jgi:hypothetical protein